MLDPVKNAKAIGVLTLIGVILSIFPLLLILHLGQPLLVVIYSLSLLFGTVTGIGLLMGKRWGVYFFGLSLFTSIGLTVYQMIQGSQPNLLTMILDVIFIGAFFWFFASRSRFN